MKDVAKPTGKRETAEEVENYRAAADTATLRNIRLIQSLLEIKPEGLSRNRESWRQGYQCIASAAEYDAEKRVISTFVDAEAFCLSGRKKIISVKCKYIVAYDVSGEPDPSAAERFAKHVGRFAAYPYFRSHFAELMSQAGLSLPPLPVMKEGKRVIGKSEDQPVGLPEPKS